VTDGESGELMDGMSAYARAMVKFVHFDYLAFTLTLPAVKL